MHVRILTSCTGEKLHSPPGQLTQNDFRTLHDAEFAAIEATLSEWRTSARDLYTGSQHLRLLQGLEAAPELQITLDIVSAGYGLIEGGRAIVPYECTFATMKTGEIDAWAKHLRLPETARAWFCGEADLNLVLLGDAYLRALGLSDQTEFVAPTLFLTGEGARKWVKGKGQVRAISLANADAKRFSFGLVGLKGEVARRLLPRLADETISVTSLFDSEFDLKDALAPVQVEVEAPAKRVATAHPSIDRVIQIPTSWWDKPHRSKLRYFIPEWDDLVDPDYDFERDTHAGGISDWSNEAYAHQLYPEPNYDGILISKVVAEKSKKKKERINRLGVHRFLRVPREFPIMGDCGAFGYIMEEKPPYTTDEMLDYYTRLDFDMGVSLDHLIVSATHDRRQFRFDLTLHNADEFLREHKRASLGWTPIGAVQGWDPASYAKGAAAMVAMGYKYIALGGMVRSTTKEILRVLDAVHRVVPSDVQMHLFGLARLGAMADFAHLGVTSVDSASYLRQAWMRTADSYVMKNDAYAALRIPEAGKSFRAKRMQGMASLSEEKISVLEQNALKSVRLYARFQCSLDNCLNAMLDYDQFVTAERVDMTGLYRKTLEARPWDLCECSICRSEGIEVCIFRGSNRNRRRGFHNTFVFYQIIQEVLNGQREMPSILNDMLVNDQQLPLFEREGVLA